MEDTVAVNTQVKPMSTYEAARLEQLQEVIVENFQSFVKVGQSLAEIRDRELYRLNFRTFEHYCKHVFDIARGTAYRYIAAAEVVSNVSNWRQKEDMAGIIDLVPINEAQVRPLTQLKPDQQIAVWKAAVETAPKGKITASHVSKVVKGYLGHEAKSKIRNTRDKVDTDSLLAADFKEAFLNFMEQVEAARDSGYKTTSRMQIVKHLDALRSIVAGDGDEIKELPLMADDGHKLIAAGFKLFRMEAGRLIIKELGDGQGWCKHSGPYESKAEMERAFKALLVDPKQVRG